MIQRFIEIGEGYSDIYELLEIINNNSHRLFKMLSLNTTINNKEVTSLIVVLTPTNPGDFQPLYMCREGIPNPEHKANKRYDLFKALAQKYDKEIISFTVKPSTIFNEKILYHQYLIGILRMNNIIPPLQ